ncbi:porphobilinogen synthase [Magnetococcales bacterium HHB-1]
MRRMVRETHLHPEDFIQPFFIVPGEGVENPVSSMPGVAQYSIDRLLHTLEEIAPLKLGGIILFGIPETKDGCGSDAYAEQGIIQQAIRRIKASHPDLFVIADLCLCEYTSHGHCGLIKQNDVDNDSTLELLGKVAVTYAKAGVDMVAPSGMMDGMVAVIRQALDDHNFASIPILSYAVKYASAFYGPFRDAAESAPSFGDRRTYQMDPANRREALREAELDVQQGADILMVKPGLPYLDILRELKQRYPQPLAVYHVSGEYSMIKAAAQQGWIEEERIVLETLTAFKRAGADMIFTYYAAQAAKWLQQQ